MVMVDFFPFFKWVNAIKIMELPLAKRKESF